MKKFFLCLTTLTLLALGATAAQPAAAQPAATPPPLPAPSYPWTFINFQFFPNVPPEAGITQTNGVKVGAPITVGEAPVYGIEASVLWAGTDNTNGLQCSLIACNAKKVTGIQFSLVNMSVSVCGVQIGIVNYAKDKTVQIGLLNFIENGPLYFVPIVNYNL